MAGRAASAPVVKAGGVFRGEDFNRELQASRQALKHRVPLEGRGRPSPAVAQNPTSLHGQLEQQVAARFVAGAADRRRQMQAENDDTGEHTFS